MQTGKDFMSPLHKEFNYFQHSKLEDVYFLAPRLRYADKQEILSLVGLPPLQALLMSFKSAQTCFTIFSSKSNPVAMFGVTEQGAIWLLATDDITTIQIPFLKECRNVVDFYNKKHPLLWNVVDCRNKLHIKWLDWCGFTFISKRKLGVLNKDFYEFVKLCVYL